MALSTQPAVATQSEVSVSPSAAARSRPANKAAELLFIDITGKSSPRLSRYFCDNLAEVVRHISDRGQGEAAELLRGAAESRSLFLRREKQRPEVPFDHTQVTAEQVQEVIRRLGGDLRAETYRDVIRFIEGSAGKFSGDGYEAFYRLGGALLYLLRATGPKVSRKAFLEKAPAYYHGFDRSVDGDTAEAEDLRKRLDEVRARIRVTPIPDYPVWNAY